MEVVWLDIKLMKKDKVLGIAAPTINWRLSVPQTYLWLMNIWFSARVVVVKIANFL